MTHHKIIYYGKLFKGLVFRDPTLRKPFDIAEGGSRGHGILLSKQQGVPDRDIELEYCSTHDVWHAPGMSHEECEAALVAAKELQAEPTLALQT